MEEPTLTMSVEATPIDHPLGARLVHHLIPAVPVPFDEHGRLDAELQRWYVKWMSGQGVGAVATWAHTGRGMHLTGDQRLEVLAAWRQEGGRLPVICGVGIEEHEDLPSSPGPRTTAAIESATGMAGEAKAGGAVGVLVHPPAAFDELADRDARVLDLHRAVAEVGLPVIAFFLYTAAGGVPYGLELVEALLEVDGVIGIKVATLDSVMTFQDLARAVCATPNRLLITGEDRFLGYTLQLGAHAALVGLGAACTDACTTLLHTWRRGRAGEFLMRSARVDAFARHTFVAPMEGYVQRMLWALEADGVFPRPAFDPFGPPLTGADRERVFAAVAALRAR